MAGTKKRREREQERRRLGLPAIPGPCPRGCILTKSGYVQENGSAYDPAARKKEKSRKQSKRRAEKEKSKRWLEGRGRGQRGEARCCATAPSAAAVDAALVAALEERPAAAAEAAHVGQHGRHSKCRGKGCAACGWRGWQSRAEPEAEQEGSSAVDAALVAVLEERPAAAEAAHVGQHGHSKCRGKGCAACGWRPSTERMVAFNTSLLAAEPRQRWPDDGTARVALSATAAEALCGFLRRARDGAKLVVGGREFTGYYDYHNTAAAEAGRRHDANEQVKFTLLLDDVDHARRHFPGLNELTHGAQCCLPEKMELLHGHVLDQTSEHTQFSDHQDTEENRKKGARRADREVVYTVIIKLSRGGDTAMRVLGCEPVAYEAAPGTGVCFRSELWHRTERASAGTVKLALFFGRWL